jgi:hypothetical protein
MGRTKKVPGEAKLKRKLFSRYPPRKSSSFALSPVSKQDRAIKFDRLINKLQSSQQEGKKKVRVRCRHHLWTKETPDETHRYLASKSISPHTCSEHEDHDEASFVEK